MRCERNNEGIVADVGCADESIRSERVVFLSPILWALVPSDYPCLTRFEVRFE